MWSQKRNYWKDGEDTPDTDEGEAEHAHCARCFKIKCQHKSTNSCSLMHCPLLCGAVFHSCKASEHKHLCNREIVPCINSLYGCKQSMRRSERGRHLATCPASVVYCTMEWNRWPVFSRERQERVPFAQKNLHARYGQLDVALAMRDQRILYEAMKAPRRMRRSLRNRLTERFPAVPLTNSHSSYVESGSSVDAAGITSDEDAGGDAPWELSRDPPGLQRSICKELFKTNSGSLHLDALDAKEQGRNDSESTDKNNSRTAACSSFVQKDTVCTSAKQLQDCDMVGSPVNEGSSGNTVDVLVGDINTANTSDFALIDRPALSPELCDKTSKDCATLEDALKQNATENASRETEFLSEKQEPVYKSSLAAETVGVADQSEVETVSDIDKELTLSNALGSKISCNSGSVPVFLFTSTSDKTCSDCEKVEPISVAVDILKGTDSSAGVTCESGFNKLSEAESITSKDTFIDNTCEKLEPAVPDPSETLCVAGQADYSCFSEESFCSEERLSKLPADQAASDFAVSNSSDLPQNSSSGAVDSESKTSKEGAISVGPDTIPSRCWTESTTSFEESSSSSSQNSHSVIAVSGEGSETPDTLTDAAETASEVTADATESHDLFPDLVCLGMDFASVSSLCHHNSVVFPPPTGGAITNPGTVVVDLPSNYHCVVESNSVPPPTFPPPLTLQQILALDLNLESITRYQAKPRSMYTFLCAQNFRRDEYPWHFRNVHSEIHGGLNSWIEARCPLACYGCTYSIRRLNPVSGTLIYDSGVDAFGVRPDSWHCRALGELFEGTSKVPERAQKETTPEIYTSKDYDSAVNITRRSHAMKDEVLEDECSSQMSSSGAMAVEALRNGTYADRLEPTGDHDVFLSCSDTSKDNVQSAFRDSYFGATVECDTAVDLDFLTTSAEGCGEPLLLSKLPFEVLQHIAHCLDSFSLCNLAMTSHFLREVCRSIVEHRGIVVQEWEKKQFETGFSWQVTYQRWLFSSTFTPVEKWHFESSPSVSEHLKVCPFNVMAEPRRLPYQLCCLAISDDDLRNQEAEKKLQKMYPHFDPKSIEFPDGSSRLPGPEVLDHLYVNEIGKSGFSGYKRALKSFAQLCSEQFRDTEKPDTEALELFEDYLEPNLEAEQVGDCLERKFETKTSVQFEDYVEPKLEIKTSEEFEDYLEQKLGTKSSEEFGDYLEPNPEIKTSEQVRVYLEPKLETKTSEHLGESLELILETKFSEPLEDYLEPKVDTEASEHFGDCAEQNIEPKT